MTVYNKVIATDSLDTLAFLFVGIVAVVAFEYVLRRRRARIIAYTGARFNAVLVNQALAKVLSLPVSMSESVSVGSQISRFRQFEGMRDFFSGHVVGAVMDLPFTLLFLGAIFFIGGPTIWVPVALVAVLVVLAVMTLPTTKRHVSETGDARSKNQSLLIELFRKIGTIRSIGAEDAWIERYSAVSRESNARKFRAQFFNTSLHTISQTLVTLAGAATLGIGALAVIHQELSVGGLIAVMMFVWRVLSPIQVTFLSLNRIGQVVTNFKQINQLMRLPGEQKASRARSIHRRFEGHLRLDGVAFRYQPTSEPILRGVTLDIPPGQSIAITGPSGAGKSTLLKLLLRLYAPQAGNIHVDELNLRQVNIQELRHSIGYQPQELTFFYGTVAQNLRLANPVASEADILGALAEANVTLDKHHFPDGLETRLKSFNRDTLPANLKQQLALARAYVKVPPIYMFDEPGAYIDADADDAFVAKLTSLRGKATVIVVTNRPSHMRVCDRVIYLANGTIVADGTPDEIVPAIMDQKARA
ncbi:MAG: ATP-binding cassette domain-containing protein, partial [Hyphomicrobiales bacterium]|nr:ATP-binding cassette domain-containing protein [Hyphomicrobiales bacterium]